MCYEPDLIHTTISDYRIKDQDKFSLDLSVITKLDRAIDSVKNYLKNPTINLIDVLYNETTTIVEGQSDVNFYDCYMKIKEACKKQGIELREPWGAHSTIGRFYQEKKPNELQRFFDLIDKSSPINKSMTLSRLEVGTFMLSQRALTQIPQLGYNI